jgi:hypothetical protein
MKADPEFAIPEGLSERGQWAARTILSKAWMLHAQYFGDDYQLSSGGCRAFYTPEEWKARGEPYGHGACLIVCHDGGDLAPLFNLDYENYQGWETMFQVLDNHGYLAESMTGWATAIYDQRK